MRKTNYAGQDHAGLSYNLWHDCPIEEINADPGVGYGFIDDFSRWGAAALPAITTAIKLNGYTCFGGATGTLTNGEALGGGLKVLTSASNEATVVQADPIFNLTKYGQPLWFEARILVSTITTNLLGFFVGLMDGTAGSPTVPLTDASALADVNLVGFHKPEANTTAYDFSYKADGVTAVEVLSDQGTLSLTTYVKLGMKYDPKDAYKLKVFIDNVELGTTKVLPDATGTDFPADVNMGPVLAVQGVSTPDHSIICDWWACYQLRA